MNKVGIFTKFIDQLELIAAPSHLTFCSSDPMGNNLYVCDEVREVVEVINLNTLSKKILLHDMAGEIPLSIALVPEEG